jgi:ATP-dependent Zn protease
MINELLIQMQSFDQPTFRLKVRNRFIEWLNGLLPKERRLKVGGERYHNILVFAATNRADSLDAALLRPGRFDQRLYFDPPTKRGRDELIDFFLTRRAHHPQLDQERVRNQLSRDTLGYTPVMLEHLFDEALLVSLKNRRREMNLEDVYDAKLTEEIGLKQEVVYTDDERRAISTHEAGHATIAFLLMGEERRLEVLSIIKRRKSLGVLSHGDKEERFTRTRSEMESLIAIALGGMVSEELFLGESGTGPASDLAAATETAVQMVGALGMSGSLVSYEAMLEGPLNAKNLSGKVLADADGKRRVEHILDTQKERARALLQNNRDIVEALRDALVERDELVGDEITSVIEIRIAGRQTVAASMGSSPRPSTTG